MAGRFLALALLAALAACGTTRADRAISGGAIGAGLGIAGAAVTDSNIGAGAVIGGLVGAAAGGLTDPDQIDLGDPIWRRY